MTFTAIVTCHESDPNPILRNLAAQTRKPDEILLECSGTCHPVTEHTDYHGMVETFHYFGYEKRQRLAEKAKGEWLGFFCHDDSYSLDYIEQMMQRAEGFLRPDVVWCRWNDRPDCRFWPCDSTLGNFIIKKEMFWRHDGFAEPPQYGVLHAPQNPRIAYILDDNHGFRDAILINKLSLDAECREAHVPEILYFHNVPYQSKLPVTRWGEKDE